DYKKHQEEPQTVRGMDLKKLETEDIPQKQQDKENRDQQLTYWYYGFVGGYLLFWTFFYKIASVFGDMLRSAGVFVQLMLFLLLALGAHKLLEKSATYFPNAKNQNIFSMMNMYAIICLLIALITVNGLSADIFSLNDVNP
ncbi:MAG: hypothetical protein IJ738_03860, partial [Alphaproteobacteria bacterium]|nr:hypothetical protein [Alphaproteobacteria bacterium]